jgi:hypothetical protein
MQGAQIVRCLRSDSGILRAGIGVWRVALCITSWGYQPSAQILQLNVWISQKTQCFGHEGLGLGFEDPNPPSEKICGVSSESNRPEPVSVSACVERSDNQSVMVSKSQSFVNLFIGMT